MGSEILLDYQGPPLLAESVWILAVGRGKKEGKRSRSPVVGKGGSTGWVDNSGKRGGANIFGITFLSWFKVDLSKGKQYCAAGSK